MQSIALVPRRPAPPKPWKLAAQVGQTPPVAESHQTPEQLTCHNWPERLSAEVLRGQQNLIARDPPHCVLIPLPEVALPDDRRLRAGRKCPRGPRGRSASRSRRLPDTTRSVSSSSPTSSNRSRRNSAAVIGAIRIAAAGSRLAHPAFPDPQRQAHAPREISSKVPSMIGAVAARKNLSGREPDVFWPLRSLPAASPANPARASHRYSGSRPNPCPIRACDSPIHRRREAQILSQPQHPRAGRFRHLRGTVGRPVIHHDHFVERPRLLLARLSSRLASRSRRFQCGITAATVMHSGEPLLHQEPEIVESVAPGFSLISPSREVY